MRLKAYKLLNVGITNDYETKNKFKKPKSILFVLCELVMGPGQNFLTLIGSAIFSLGLGLENFL